MPMIPAGRVDVADPIAPPTILLPPPPPPEDDCLVLNEDGSIDNRATTNRWASLVQEILDEPADCNDPTFCAGIIIFAGQKLNFRFGQISNFTGLPRHFCAKVVRNLGHSHLIFKRHLAGELAEVLEKEPDDHFRHRILFVLYCLAGSGRVRREKDRWIAVKDPDDVFFYTIDEVS